MCNILNGDKVTGKRVSGCKLQVTGYPAAFAIYSLKQQVINCTIYIYIHLAFKMIN
jgi:hypothetical protein